MTLNTRKTIYGICSAAAPLSGTACGVLGGMVVGVASCNKSVHFISENAQKDYISENAVICIVLAAAFVAALVGLCILTGQFKRDEDDKIKLNWFDKIWTEVHLIVCVLAATGAICCALPIADIIQHVNWLGIYEPVILNDYFFSPFSNVAIMEIAIAGMLICIELAVLSFVSLIKKLKAGRFLDTALLGKLCIAVWNGGKNLAKQFMVPNDNEEKAGKQLMFKIVGLSVLMVLFAMTWIGVIVDLILIVAIIPNKIRKYMDIRKGVAEVKSGNLNHRIALERDDRTGELKNDLDKLADDINQITLASNTAVQNELKIQRMKTDLISNVSHDLKTPLTSMISYLDILQKEGLDSPHAQEYLDIVQEKTEKLKALTEDLFDAAKASSGNIPCEITTIDIVSMLNQELAEMNDVLAEHKLDVIKTVKTENTKVRADGKLLSRVIENLLGNIGKYALDDSRVYADITECGDMIQLDLKNISRDQLNISPEELMERFTRGDASRNTEGSGLGLSIAKDLTVLMGGTFDISIDGDMFKATIKLPANSLH